MFPTSNRPDTGSNPPPAFSWCELQTVCFEAVVRQTQPYRQNMSLYIYSKTQLISILNNLPWATPTNCDTTRGHRKPTGLRSKMEAGLDQTPGEKCFRPTHNPQRRTAIPFQDNERTPRFSVPPVRSLRRGKSKSLIHASNNIPSSRSPLPPPI